MFKVVILLGFVSYLGASDLHEKTQSLDHPSTVFKDMIKGLPEDAQKRAWEDFTGQSYLENGQMSLSKAIVIASIHTSLFATRKPEKR